MPDVIVEHDVAVPVRDGTVLRADVYRPAATGSYPVLLGRTCYGKRTWGRWIEPERTAADGYVVVINDLRGLFASDGVANPFFDDIDDGHDVVEWCAVQPWSNGRVGMFGSSAPGFVQLLAALAQPEHLVAIAPMQTWSSFGRGCVYDPGGGFYLFTQLWALMLADIDPERRLDAARPGYADRRERVARAVWKPAAGYSHLPLTDLPALGRPESDYFYRWLEHPDHDGFWAALDIERHYERIQVPALHLVGLADKFRHGSVRNYRGLRDRAATEAARNGQRLVIGPWTHGVPVRNEGSELWFGVEGAVDVRAVVLRWYDHWLKGIDNGLLDESRVRVFATGANAWREFDDWPPRESGEQTLYLRSDGRANSSSGDGALLAYAPGDEPPDTYRYDPQDPAPTNPRNIGRAEGPLDLSSVETRSDLLVYSTPPLEHDLEVHGAIELRLWASTSGVDTDWIATVCDVEPGGRSIRVTSGMLRARYRTSQEVATPVEPGVAHEYRLDVMPTAHRFAAGHRLRVTIASASFPQFDRNLNRGRPFDAELAGSAVTQLVFHDRDRPSQLRLRSV